MLHHKSHKSYSSFLETENKATANTKADVLFLSILENPGIARAYHLCPVVQKNVLSFHYSIQMHYSDSIVNILSLSVSVKTQWF